MKPKFDEFYEYEEREAYTLISGFKKYLGYSRFPDFRGHENISFSEDIYEIASGKFSHARIKSVHIPQSVEKIYDNAFSECRSLRFLQFDEGVAYIGKCAFSHIPVSQVFFPDSLEVIGEGAFEKCDKLASVEFGDGVTEIGKRAFAETALLTVTLPPSLCKVGKDAFSGCKRLTDVTFSNCDIEADKKQILDILANSNDEEYDSFCTLLFGCAPLYTEFLAENMDFFAKSRVEKDLGRLVEIISSDYSVSLDEVSECIKRLDKRCLLCAKDFDLLSALASEHGKSDVNEKLFLLKNELFPESADISQIFKL